MIAHSTFGCLVCLWYRRVGRGLVCCGAVRVALGIVACGLFAPAFAHAAVRVAPVSVHRLSGDIYEYYYVLATGHGAHDRVGVHRVVKVSHGNPVAARDGVFLVHGDGASFDNDFRLGKTAGQSVAVFLASKGIDVWGVDLGWTLVPASTSDLSFMRAWGLQHDLNDVEKALAFARSVRARTGSTRRKLTLLAYSRGGWIGYALLNQESQEPKAKQEIRAFIPVDTMVKTNDSSLRANACSFASFSDTQLASGVYGYSHKYVIQLGRLARKHPNQTPPPTVRMQTGTPGDLTNQQAAERLGAAPFQTGQQLPRYFHVVAGTFPNENIDQPPTGLAYTVASRWDDALATASWFEPVALIRDAWAATCSDRPDRFDDHLKEVTVPVFYVGAGGGIGPAGLYSLTLLGSKHITSHIVSFHPPADAALDFGHSDLFYARDAEQLVWAPIYHWLVRHSN